MDLRKLKDQKGLTGVDVVIALTIISVTTIAILAIYVNVISNSKKSTRASAASRIATSMLSNVDYMYYAEVEKELVTIRDNAGVSGSGMNFIAHVKDSKAFNTKIASGYDVEIDCTEISTNKPGGTVSLADGDVGNCPLVLEIKVKVNYEVSGVNESVSLKTVKKRELLDYCNEPDLNWLIGKNINGFKVKSLNEIQPIKWAVDADSYIRTNSTDSWYNYINGDWAKVAITTDNKVFDAATGAIDKSKILSGNIPVFMWIPRVGYSETDGSLIFAYRSSNDAIHQMSLKIGKDANERTLVYNGLARYNYVLKKIEDRVGVNVNTRVFNSNESGVWVRINGTGSGGSNQGNTLQVENGRDFDSCKNIIDELDKSKFGPVKNHLGKKYY